MSTRIGRTYRSIGQTHRAKVSGGPKVHEPAGAFVRMPRSADQAGVLSACDESRTLNAVGTPCGARFRWQEVAVGIIAWIVLGAIAGFITNLIMGGKEGVVGTVILGIIGGVVGGYIAGNVLKVADITGLNIQSIVVAVFGGIIVVAVYRFFTGRRSAV
jgi:uncharacterized membrane protein YeaQ/YmgE (transglycosylase-associated protein family)